MSDMRILVVSSCTKRKKKEKDKASEIYLGKQHLYVKKGVKLLKENNNVDWYIISAKYGIINENEVIEPYDLSFNKMSRKDIRELSTGLGIEEKLSSLIKNYKLAFFILGEKYLISIEDLLDKLPISSVFFTNRELPHETVKCGIKEAKKYHIPMVSLKGYLFLEYIKKKKI